MRKLPFARWLFGIAVLLLLAAPASADYCGFTGYLPPGIPTGTCQFGTVYQIYNPEPPYNGGSGLGWPPGIYWPSSGYYAAPNLDDPTAYVMNPVTDYMAPSPMENQTPGPGDLLDYNFVWVLGPGNYVIWDMGSPAPAVRVFPCQDHQLGTGQVAEFDEYDVYGSNDLTNWFPATLVQTYTGPSPYKTHDGVTDFGFPPPNSYRYIKLQTKAEGGYDFEIDAIELIPRPSGLGILATIDIRPHSFANMINSKSRGQVQVAIFGQCPGFDVTQIDPASIRIGPAGLARRGHPSSLKYTFKDVNHDGCLDMVVTFNVADLASILPATGTELLTLTGNLYSQFGGTFFAGTDFCHVPPGPSPLPKP